MADCNECGKKIPAFDVYQYAVGGKTYTLCKTCAQARNNAIEEGKRKKERERYLKCARMIVTTGDLKQDYEVIGPVYCQLSNKGFLSNTYNDLCTKYSARIQSMNSRGQLPRERIDWGFLYGEWTVGQNSFDKAFYIAVEELKERASMLDADAIIGMKQDIDLDTNGLAFFYLQMYGTAVKFKIKTDTVEE